MSFATSYLAARLQATIRKSNIGGTPPPNVATVEPTILQSVPSEIFSYIFSFLSQEDLSIEDYRDIARLRLFSKSMKNTLPLSNIMNRIDCSYGGTSSHIFKAIVPDYNDNNFDHDYYYRRYARPGGKGQERAIAETSEDTIIEGVAITDGMIPFDLRNKLNIQIDALAESQHFPDYHPNSNGIVRDLVHPALYSYVKEISRISGSPDEVDPCTWHNGHNNDDQHQHGWQRYHEKNSE